MGSYQNRHQGRAGASFKAVWASRWWSWSICWSLAVSCVSRLSIRASIAAIAMSFPSVRSVSGWLWPILNTVKWPRSGWVYQEKDRRIGLTC